MIAMVVAGSTKVESAWRRRVQASTMTALGGLVGIGVGGSFLGAVGSARRGGRRAGSLLTVSGERGEVTKEEGDFLGIEPVRIFV